jgi:DNA gyrase/topoisomerase IV subunit B
MTIIHEIGEKFINIANSIDIPYLLLDMLYVVNEYISKDSYSHDDIRNIKRVIAKNNNDIKYNNEDNIFTISIGIKDYHIHKTSLVNAFKSIDYICQEFKSFNSDILIKSKIKNKRSYFQVTPMQLYKICNEFNNLYTIKRFKGIGSMPSNDRKISCMDENTRTIHRINSIGDIDDIYGMLGVDADYRKKHLIKSLF